MEKEVVIALIIGFVVFSLSVSILRKFDSLPGVELPQPKLPCPDVRVNITGENFHEYLMKAKSGCSFNATMRFHPSQELLNDEARVLGLVDEQGKPTVLEAESCDLPFSALIICNGTVFPGDQVLVYSDHGVIIQKKGR